jgi:outer membrane receptor protein involved in Fe transport
MLAATKLNQKTNCRRSPPELRKLPNSSGQWERGMRRDRFYGSGLLVSASLASLLAAASAQGQTAPPADPQATDPAGADTQAQEQEIVVQGFRASLDNALNLKREETAAVDSIVAEDIGKFPDSNLAESMQRIPGVALSRGDGGEGRNISVRGLGRSSRGSASTGWKACRRSAAATFAAASPRGARSTS